MSKKYVGKRYVPKIMGEWNILTPYESLCIVTHSGTSYTSKKDVPVGIEITNESYWVITGNYNAQVEGYRQEVQEVNSRLADIENEKSTKLEVEIERQRINSFTSLAQGSTTGDAELIDARVGADGVTYANTGSAVRGQFNKIADDVNSLKVEVSNLFQNPKMLPTIGSASYVGVTYTNGIPTFDNAIANFSFRSDVGNALYSSKKYLLRYHLKATNDTHTRMIVRAGILDGSTYVLPITDIIDQNATANHIYDAYYEFTISADVSNPRFVTSVVFSNTSGSFIPGANTIIDWYDISIIDITNLTDDEIEAIKYLLNKMDFGIVGKIPVVNISNYSYRAKVANVAESVTPPYVGKKVLVMGDSIMSVGINTVQTVINEILKPSVFVNVAVSGATWTDFTDTPVYDGNPTTGSHNNVLGNQVQKIINNHGVDSNYDDFDICIIGAGTNDEPLKFGWINPNWNVVTDATIESYFTGDTSVGHHYNFIDINTIDRTTITGAMRYCIEKLYVLYPSMKIFISLPIQCGVGDDNYYVTLHKSELIERIAHRMSLETIDTQNCGIYGRYETAGVSGKYLSDGLHPNIDGGRVEAKYICRAIAKYYEIQ